MEFRKSLFLLFALAGSLVSHIVGGGSFISPTRFLSELALISGAMLLLRGHEYEGPALAFALLIVQGTAHFILGGGSSSDVQMLISHILGGALSYQFIVRFDRIWKDLYSLFASWLPKVLKPYAVAISTQIAQHLELTIPNFKFSHDDFSRRGPPCN